MARSPTTSDVFNAVAEVQRRRILELLLGGERSVGQIAEALGFRQPQTSKHLQVLKEVGLVTVRGDAQQRLYQLDSKGIREIHEWTKPFERLWSARLDRLNDYLHALQQKGGGDASPEPSTERNTEPNPPEGP
ncbi:ArsR/SmtB family transcription factor [Deinococcus antarcticus]|uniref:ArsR/SmtB family transcription factor n=1 Tax=Deinococcus antarcticus TaxID=1298767 RepID=A0ABV8A732_9DEIO